MKNHSLLIFLSTILTLSTSLAQSVAPGYWHKKESFKINGITLPAHEDKDCVSSKEAKDVKASIVESLQKKGCSLTHWNIKGEDLQAGLKCKNDDFKAKGTLTGKFTKKTYTLEGSAKGKIRDTFPAKADLNLQGQWISTCPKPAGTT